MFNIVPIESAREMFEEVTGRARAGIIIKAAAVADYRPQTVSDEKVKKSGDHMTLELEKTDDILKYLGEHKKRGSVPLWLFHGDRTYAGEFQGEAQKRKILT